MLAVESKRVRIVPRWHTYEDVMKTYPLEIEPCHTDDERMYRSKGHHSLDDFVQALKEYGLSGKWSTPVEVYVKTTPAHKDSDFSCLYSVVDKSVRGSYPATYVYEYGDCYMEIK